MTANSLFSSKQQHPQSQTPTKACLILRWKIKSLLLQGGNSLHLFATRCGCFFFFFYPNKEVYFGFQIQSFSPPTLPPHGKSPNNIVLQTGTDILSKPAAESSLGLPGKRGKRGGHIMVINTSQNTEGIHVWACSAAYVDPAASLRSESAQAPTGISIIPS